MNVFEDLVVELEDEDLLEKTVSNNSSGKDMSNSLNVEMFELTDIEDNKTAKPLEISILENDYNPTNEEISEKENFLKQFDTKEQKKPENQEIKKKVQNEANVLEIDTPTQIPLDSLNPPLPPTHNEPQILNPKQKLTEFEFFRKRAINEVALLQMIDNIFSSVEREQMKIIPKPYYDLPVKKILHSFLQLPANVNLSEHAEAEFELLQETENWYAALSVRDKKISVEKLRYCCETTKPPLSPPALLSLARFYRNSPFSESVRNKFDLIITRLFLRDIEDNKRELVFTREELIEHLQDLYAEWESIPCYSTDESDEEILLTVKKFEEFIKETNAAQVFDDLIKSEIFNRIRTLKRGTGEYFFAPQIAAASIICNVHIGNRYLDLLQLEQIQTFEESIEEKYGFLFDQSVSNATNKSVQIVEILKEQRANPKFKVAEALKRQEAAKQQTQKVEKKQKEKEKTKFEWLQGINKGLLAAMVLTVLLSASLYLWVEVLAAPPKKAENVQEFNLENSEFKDSIKSAKISNETLFAISSPAWETTQNEKKEEILNKLLVKGKERGYKKVHLLNQKGLTVGTATQNKVEVK